MSNLKFDIVDIFEGVKNDIFTIQPYLSINKSLKNFTTTKFSISIPLNGQDISLDVDTQIISLLRNEINQNIYKSILKELFSTSKFDYVDIIKTVNTHQSINDIIYFLHNENIDNKYDYLMSNTNLANSLADSSLFNFKSVKGGSSVVEFRGIPYLFGSLVGYDVYLDPFMRFDDSRICLFDSCEINIENITQTVVASNTFNPRMIISYDLAYNIGDSKVIFVLDGDESTTSHKQYKQLQRDIKINSVLDADK
jgi:predicted amino acid-binding ACT domain protein